MKQPTTGGARAGRQSRSTRPTGFGIPNEGKTRIRVHPLFLPYHTHLNSISSPYFHQPCVLHTISILGGPVLMPFVPRSCPSSPPSPLMSASSSPSETEPRLVNPSGRLLLVPASPLTRVASPRRRLCDRRHGKAHFGRDFHHDACFGAFCLHVQGSFEDR